MAIAADERRRRDRDREPVDPWRPIAVFEEPERSRRGRELALTVLLAGAECAFSCSYCDLWRRTLPHPTPLGAIPRQIEQALLRASGKSSLIKLYNASNFFQESAVPAADDAPIAALLAGFERVVVESHPKLVAERCAAFAGRLEGTLEVAMGLETSDPEVLQRLDRGMTLDDFERAAMRLSTMGAALRAFVILGLPFRPLDETVDATLETVRYAADRGAEVVSVIPIRPSESRLLLAARAAGAPGAVAGPGVALTMLEEVARRAVVEKRCLVQVDLWDLAATSSCVACFDDRRRRLEACNLQGTWSSLRRCAACGEDLP